MRRARPGEAGGDAGRTLVEERKEGQRSVVRWPGGRKNNERDQSRLTGAVIAARKPFLEPTEDAG